MRWFNRAALAVPAAMSHAVTSLSPLPRALPIPPWRVAIFALAVGSAGAVAPLPACLAVAGALVLAEVLARRDALAPPARVAIVGVAAASLAPWLATLAPRDACLAVAALAWAITAWRAPGTALLLVLALAPLHTLALSLLEGRWHVDPGALGYWKELGLAVLAARVVVEPAARAGWSEPGRWAPPLRWAAAALAWIGVQSALALVRHDVGVGLAVRGWAADLGPFALLAIAFGAARARLVDAARVRRAVVALGSALAGFGFAQLAWIGPRWYAAVGYGGPRDFKVPGYEHYRLTSTFLDPLPAGLFLAVAALVALDGALVATRTRGARARLAAAAALTMAASLASFTRSAWIGLALGVAIVAAVRWREPGVRRALAAALAAAALLALPLAPRLAAWTRDTATGAATDTSSPRHWEAWRRGAQTIADHPLGLGPGRAGEVSVRVLGAAGIVTESSYLQFGVEYGVAGLVGAAGFVASVARALAGALRRRAAGGTGADALAAWCALAVAALFLHALTERPVAYPVMALAGLALAGAPRAGETR